MRTHVFAPIALAIVGGIGIGCTNSNPRQSAFQKSTNALNAESQRQEAETHHHFVLLHEYHSSATPINGAMRDSVLKGAHTWVKRNIASPATASFSEESVKRTTDGNYIAVGAVDAQNGFGALIRNWYIYEMNEDGTPAFGELVQFDPNTSGPE